ncbi:hypothetical protein [Peribacillus butanolivorans]
MTELVTKTGNNETVAYVVDRFILANLEYKSYGELDNESAKTLINILLK